MIAALLIITELLLQDIRKKEESKYGKHDKQFDKNDPPLSPAPGHVPETIIIKPEDLFEHRVNYRLSK